MAQQVGFIQTEPFNYYWWSFTNGEDIDVAQLNPEPGDLQLFHVQCRPSSVQLTTPSGWTKYDDNTGTDYGAEGSDTGSVRSYVYYRVCDGTEGTANVSFAISSGTVSVVGVNTALVRSSTGTYDLAKTSLARNGDTTAFGTSSSADIGFTTGDLVIQTAVLNGNVSNPPTWAIATAGVTFSTPTDHMWRSSSEGNDVALHMATSAVTAGTSYTTYATTCTLSAAASGVYNVIRIREGTGSARTDPWVRSASLPAGFTSSMVQTMPQHDVGDMLILSIINRDEVEDPLLTPGTPTGWTSLGSWVGGQGSFGNDSGLVRTTVFYKEVSSVDYSNVTLTITGNATGESSIVVFAKNENAGDWDTPIAEGASVNTASTTWSQALDDTMALKSGGLVMATLGINSDYQASTTSPSVGPGVQRPTSLSLAASGVTFDNIQIAAERPLYPNNIGILSFTGRVTTGATATPTVGTTFPSQTAFNGSVPTNAPSGSVVLVHVWADTPDYWASQIGSTLTSSNADKQRGLAYYNGYFWTFNYNGVNNRYEFWYSTDGGTWTENTSARITPVSSSSLHSARLVINETNGIAAFVYHRMSTSVGVAYIHHQSGWGTTSSWVATTQTMNGATVTNGVMAFDVGVVDRSSSGDYFIVIHTVEKDNTSGWGEFRLRWYRYISSTDAYDSTGYVDSWHNTGSSAYPGIYCHTTVDWAHTGDGSTLSGDPDVFSYSYLENTDTTTARYVAYRWTGTSGSWWEYNSDIVSASNSYSSDSVFDGTDFYVMIMAEAGYSTLYVHKLAASSWSSATNLTSGVSAPSAARNSALALIGPNGQLRMHIILNSDDDIYYRDYDGSSWDASWTKLTNNFVWPYTATTLHYPLTNASGFGGVTYSTNASSPYAFWSTLYELPTFHSITASGHVTTKVPTTIFPYGDAEYEDNFDTFNTSYWYSYSDGGRSASAGLLYVASSGGTACRFDTQNSTSIYTSVDHIFKVDSWSKGGTTSGQYPQLQWDYDYEGSKVHIYFDHDTQPRAYIYDGFNTVTIDERFTPAGDWYRVRELDGTISIATSADGQTWTTHESMDSTYFTDGASDWQPEVTSGTLGTIVLDFYGLYSDVKNLVLSDPLSKTTFYEDNFNTFTDGVYWDVDNGDAPTVSNGLLTIDHTTGNVSSAIDTVDYARDFENTEYIFKVDSWTKGGTTTGNFPLIYIEQNSTPAAALEIAFNHDTTPRLKIWMDYQAGGGQYPVEIVTPAGKWYRVREWNNVLSIATSADGETWTTHIAVDSSELDNDALFYRTPYIKSGTLGTIVLDYYAKNNLWSTGPIGIGHPLSASGATTTAGSADISKPLTLTASGATSTAGSADIDASLPLAASGATSTAGTADISKPLILTASGATATTGTADISTARPITASGATATSGSASIVAARPLTASGATATAGSADILTARTLSATGATSTAGSASIAQLHSISAIGWSGSERLTDRMNGHDTTYTDTPLDWPVATTYLTGGGLSYFSVANGINVTGTPDWAETLFQTECYGGDFTFTFSGLGSGTHRIDIAFAELYWEVSGSRVFDVIINGVTELNDYDIYADVGFLTATVKSFEVTPVAGSVTIRFLASTDNAKVSAIEINELGGSSASLGIIQPVSASGATATTGTADIDAEFSLSSTGATTTAGTADISKPLTLTASGATSTAGTADILTARQLSASGATTTAGTSTIRLSLSVAATGATATSGTAELDSLARPISATGATTTAGSADILASRNLSASGATTTSGSAALESLTRPISATGATTTVGSASLTQTHVASASGTTLTVGTADILSTRSLSASGATATAGSASLNTARPVSADGATATSGTADILTARTLSATGATTTSGTATLDPLSRPISATGATTTAGSADLIATRPISASGATTSAGTADISTARPVSAFGASTTSGTADIGLAHSLAADGASTTAGTADILSARPLTASGATTTAGSADIISTRPLSSSGSTTTSGTASLTVSHSLLATGASTTAGSASTHALFSLASTGSSPTDGDADATAIWSLSSSGATTTLGFAELVGAGPRALSASGHTQTAGSADIIGKFLLDATGATITSGSADIVTKRPLSPDEGATATAGTADVNIVASYSASGATTTSGSADVDGLRALEASGSTSTIGSADLVASRPVTASGSTSTTGTASINTARPLSATGATSTAGTADIISTRPLSASGHVTTAGSAALTGDWDDGRPLSATGSTVTIGSADIRKSQGFSASGDTITDAPSPPLVITRSMFATGHTTTAGTGLLSLQHSLLASGATTTAGTTGYFGTSYGLFATGLVQTDGSVNIFVPVRSPLYFGEQPATAYLGEDEVALTLG